ncbi:MAG: alpha-glucan family phosphorylase [Betaproteobacteria bacterium]|jgi:starch phosphorylase|nr:alpha-glucan family phosphorylase [Betaproteobacteria bacterium]
MQPGTPYSLQVNPKIPRRLARLEELAHNLWYSWDRATRELFSRLDPQLWESVAHSPKAFLKRVDEQNLVDAAGDPVYLSNFNRVLSAFDTYQSEPTRADGAQRLSQSDLVAYFCFEFGFHESCPIYSGGLGILAGDHCKAASDMRMPFVAVGLIYRQGYFQQTIDSDGNQHVAYSDSDFEDLPVTVVTDNAAAELRIAVELPGRVITLRVWRVLVGRVNLYLLDTDVEENAPADRAIGHRLYGGDRITRIEQEIVLGIGGARALAAMDLKPTVWHINEGHAAFLVLERIRNVMRQGLDFPAALEAVAASTVFTTHTPVAAGHDQFSSEMIESYFNDYCRELKITAEHLLALGRTPNSADFNMTALAVRGSRVHNGVSRIHGGVSAKLLRELWPQITPEENPVTHITNGVHVPTFLAPEWVEVFNRAFGLGWSQRFANREMWDQIAHLPDHFFWSMHQYLKSQLLHLVRYRIRRAHLRNQGSEAHLDRLFKFADPANPNVLTIGFGRRFATYKRATLLFEDLEWLREITGDTERPVLFIYTGKAHPADKPGQDLIRQVSQVARMPEFEGRILLVEGYDLHFSRRLVSGVDVWLNNPVFPLEASGTSGMKAAMNGIINLSVLDGWWEEGYDGTNGWAIKPATDAADEYRRNREESRALYEILQDQVIPLYYARGNIGHSPGWIQMAKRSIASIAPHFNAARMVGEYVANSYVPASQQGRRFAEDRYTGAIALATWKSRVRHAWPRVSLRRLDAPKKRIAFGESFLVEVAVALNGLSPEDVVVEILMNHPRQQHRFELAATGAIAETGEQRFAVELTPDLCGQLEYRIRAYPCHALLTHPFEMGLMIWA